MLNVTSPRIAKDVGSDEGPALVSFYAVAGRFICVEAADREFAFLFRRHMAGWHVSALEGAVPAHDAKIIVRRGVAPPVPPGLDTFETAGGLCHTDGRTYFLESDGSAVRVGVESPRRVEVWVGAGPASRERAGLARLTFSAAMTALRRCGLFELHAAGVVEPATGAGLLIVGPSGSGKSTLATQLARAGWQYLSDDALLLQDKGGRVGAHALRRHFAVTETTVEAGILGGLGDVLTAPLPFDPLKRRFEPREAFPGRFAQTCVPRAVIFPVVAGETASVSRRLSQAELMRGLIRMCPWACYDKPAAAEHLRVLAGLARQAAGYELRAGTDLLGSVGYASRFMRAFAPEGS